jgi:hypothetical protein
VSALAGASGRARQLDQRLLTDSPAWIAARNWAVASTSATCSAARRRSRRGK